MIDQIIDHKSHQLLIFLISEQLIRAKQVVKFMVIYLMNQGDRLPVLIALLFDWLMDCLHQSGYAS